MSFVDEFYVVDAGYPNISGFLAPYRGECYHRNDFGGRGRPRTKVELFNQRHSSVRNVIERCFGVLKARFPILKLMPNYPLRRQRCIPLACCTLHNFIRMEARLDTLFQEYENLNFSVVDEHVLDDAHDNGPPVDLAQSNNMAILRDAIADKIWDDYCARRDHMSRNDGLLDDS